MRQRLLVAGLVAATVTPVRVMADPCSPAVDPGEDGRIEIVRDYIASTYAPPMAGLSVAYEGELAATSGLGGADGQTMFWIASTSKLVTAVGAIVLIEEGLLDPDAPVTDYVVDFTENAGRQDSIVVQHLLQNRSGLPQDGGCVGFACRQDTPGNATTVQYNLMSPDRGATLGNIFTPTMLAQEPYSVFNITSFEPGTGYEYSGWGWMLAGRTMEIAASETFDVLMERRILDPARLCRATYDGALVDANVALGTGVNAIDGWCLELMLAPGHQGEGEPYYHDELDCAARMPQGGLHASAHDMGLLADAILRDLNGADQLAGADAMRLLFCPDGGSGVPGSDNATCFGRADVTEPYASQFGHDYGLGNFRRTYDYEGITYDLYNHGGGRAGFSAYFALIPEIELAVVVLINAGGAANWHDVAECAIRVYVHGATSCAAGCDGPVRDLRMAKSGTSDVSLAWTARAAASEYNVWRVADKAQIDAARRGDPAADGVPGCSSPSPTNSPACLAVDELNVAEPIAYYQVRAWCEGTGEGP